MKNRTLSIFLTLAMVLSLTPTIALAKVKTENSPTCVCETICISKNMNAKCPTCGAKGALPKSCMQYALVKGEQTAVANNITLTLILPDGLSAESMEVSAEGTYKVASTVGNDGNIAPIVISCEDDGAFSNELAAALGKTDIFKSNALTAVYDEAADTLIISGAPKTSVEIDMNTALAAAMENMNSYTAQQATTEVDLAGEISISGNQTLFDININRIDAEGHVTVPTNATLTLDGVTIDGNNLDGSCGMIQVNGGTLIIKNSTIQNCKASATKGAAICVEGGGTLTIENTTIQGCQDTSEGGGAIYMDCSTVTINSGTFQNNKANSDYLQGKGGFIYNEGGTLTINGGMFLNNCAGDGGAIYAAASSGTNVYINGGTFTNNTASNSGGSGTVFISQSDLSECVFSVSGDAAFTGGESVSVDGIYFGNTNSKMLISSALKSDVHVYLNSIDSSLNTYAKGTDYILTQADAQKLTFHSGILTDTTTYNTLLNTEQNYLYFSEAQPSHIHCVCAKTDCSGTGHDATTEWTAISSLSEIQADGNYYLTNDVTLSATWTCSNNVNICLNSKTITGANGQDVISVDSGGNLVITDCQTDAGKIIHEAGVTGCGVNISSSRGSFTLWNGNITGNTITDNNSSGGGVYNWYGTFNMYGGSIDKNNANRSGGGVCNYGTFNVSDNASITGNSVVSYGGGVYNYGTLNMSGGSITGNKVTGLSSDYDGGGVYNLGTLNISGTAKITSNNKNSVSSNVYLKSGKTITAESDIDSTANIGITGTLDKTVVNGSIDTTIFTSDNVACILTDDGSNGLKLTDAPVAISGVTLLSEDDGTAMTSGKTYDGKAVAYDASCVIYTPSVPGVVLSYTWQVKNSDSYTDIADNAAPKDAGEYRLFVVVTKNGNILGETALPFSITKASGTGSVTMDDWTYNATEKNPVLTSDTNGTDNVTYLYKVKDAQDSTYIEDKPTQAGTYTIKATFPENNNYTGCVATDDFTIEQYKVSIVNVKVEASKIYDGNNTATIISAGTINEKKIGDDLVISVGTAKYDDENVDTNKIVTFSGFALDGADKDNYKLISQPQSTTADITAKVLTIKNLAVADKIYDGLNTAYFGGTPTLDDVVDDDDVTLINGTPNFASANVGDNIAIEFSEFKLEGEDSGNYKLSQPSGVTANIYEYNPCGLEYSVNSNDWLNVDFVITAAQGWQVSLDYTANSDWSDSLTCSDETDSGVFEFYVKNIQGGFISEKITEYYKVDKTAPVISGVENNKTYCEAVILTVTDENLDTVLLNGAPVALSDGRLTLNPTEGEQTVLARDKAGNSASVAVTVNDDHTWSKWLSNGDGTHSRTCKFDSTHTEKSNCCGGRATCTNKALCEICGKGYGSLVPHELTYTAAKAPTATETGNTEYWYCSGCGKYFSDESATQEIKLSDTVIAKLKTDAETTQDSDVDSAQDSDTKAAQNSDVDTPQNGDSSNILLCLVLFIVCIGAATLMIFARRKNKYYR